MDIIIATKNVGKVREFKSIIKNENVVLLSLLDIGFKEEIDETGNSFEENAVIKARLIAKKYNKITISDDSGLEVFGLNNEPGIYSARYAGIEHNDDKNNKLLIEKCRYLNDRKCRYVCAVCIFHPDGSYKVIRETCEGEIILEPRGTNGFGYDPYFYVSSVGKTFAELPLDEKNKLSHRAKALRKIKDVCNEDFTFK